MNTDQLLTLAGQLLGGAARHWQADRVEIQALVPDGSSRGFYRLRTPDGRSVVAVLPPDQGPLGLAEARSFAAIGHHLFQAGAPVPEIYGFDPATGLALSEDLGDRRLFAQVTEQGTAASRSWYEATVRVLARMQVHGAVGFDPAWCWDTPRYDRQLMIERESDYFLKACCTDLLGLHFDRQVMVEECANLATAAAQAPAKFFLHRDFQCRNIMLTDGAVRFVDFQGGRLGPLAYDLASLLRDPYAGLPEELQEHLIEVYLEALHQEITYDVQQFRREYLLLALQRNLQILGAFAFLSRVRGKNFFAAYLAPALASLGSLLAKPELAGYAALRRLTDHCSQELCQRS